jgi:hypothetical protein
MKGKDLIGIPWMVAAALRADGWHLRSDVIVAKPSPRPESVLDRPTLGHEHLLLLSKSERYAYDRRAVPEAQTTIWEVPRNNNASGHGAPMPVDLARRCVLLSTRSGDAVLDPFGGSGTTGRVALSLGRNATLVEVKKSYAAFAARSLADRNPGSGAPIGELARLDPARARSVIRAALRGAGARVDGAAAHLRVSDTTLRRIMRDIDLKPSFKPLRA